MPEIKRAFICGGVFFSLLANGWGEFVSDPKTSYVLLFSSGVVEVAAAGKDEWKPVQSKQTFQPGDRIRAGQNSKATIRLNTDKVIKVAASTTFKIPAPEKK